MFAEEFVSDDYAAHAQDMSGVQGAPPQGAAPYPLYGLSQDAVEVVPFYKKPLFCWVGGAAVGVGIGYLVFGFLKPRMKPNPKKRKKPAAEEE